MLNFSENFYYLEVVKVQKTKNTAKTRAVLIHFNCAFILAKH